MKDKIASEKKKKNEWLKLKELVFTICNFYIIKKWINIEERKQWNVTI